MTEKQDPTSRRKFLNFSLWGTFLVTLGGIFYPLARYLLPSAEGSARSGQQMLRLPLAELPPGKARKAAYGNLPVWIIHTRGGQISVLDARCTHLGCIVEYDESTGTLLCPCHAALFDENGNVKGGPAPRPLPTLTVHQTESEIVIGG